MNQFQSFKNQVEETKKLVFGEIDRIIAELEENGDVSKFYDKGVKSAGGRIKKGMQAIKKAIHHPTVKSHMTALQTASKELKENIGK
jgi:hypothetical protein